MSFLDEKTRTRRTVHRMFALSCTLSHDDVVFDITARLHTQMRLGGDIESQGYATTIEGIQRVVMNREELALLNSGAGVVPSRGDIVVFQNYKGPGQHVTVELDARDPHDGPVDEKWSVVSL